MKEEIIKTIRETLYLKEGQISDSTQIESIAKDSMDIVELIAVLSNKYRVAINPAQMNHIKTVADIVEYVTSHENTIKDTDPMNRF